MIYESKVQFTTIDRNGNDKVVRHGYIVSEADTFGDAEEQSYGVISGVTDADVVDVRRSKLKEIINHRTSDEQMIYMADVADIRINDEGEQTEIVYKVALFAKDLDDAYNKVKVWLEQDYNMVALGVKKTKFNDIIS